jgi:serine phosphatase RsbU (regulator of sigma subunit)/CheY-like chemotaxis protein
MTVNYINVLVVDDDADRGEILSRPFSNWGWGVKRVPSKTTNVIQILKTEAIDLILVDLNAAERLNYALLRSWRDDPHLFTIPLVITARPNVPLSRLVRCIEIGASDYITHPDLHVLLRARLQNVLQRRLLEEQASTALEAFNEIEKIADDLRLVILPIGAALSAETEYDRLIARIVEEVQSICNADAGILYLSRDDGTMRYAYVHVRSLNYTYQDSPSGPAAFAPLWLSDPETGEPNYQSLPVFVALSGEAVNLADLHQGRFNLERLLLFEGENDYQATSCLTVPLRNGQIVGALLLMNCQDPLSGDVVPFDAYHQQVAESMASQAAVVLNNRLLSERQARLLRYKRELEIGREIQLGFLPREVPSPPGWDVAAQFWPALEVAGDFYDATLLPHGYLAFVIADIVGKGVMAALFMAIVRTLFRALFQQNYFQAPVGETTSMGGTTPFSFIDRTALLNAVRLTNSYLLANHADTYAFATLFAGVLDPVSGRLIYVNAGHNLPLLLEATPFGRHIKGQLAPTGPAIGLIANADYHLAETQLFPGDMLYAFTDGVTEARNVSAEEFGEDRLIELLESLNGSSQATLDAVEQAIDAHTGNAETFDDVTMLAIRRL